MVCDCERNDGSDWKVVAEGSEDMPYMDTGDMSVSENELWDDVADIGSGW